MIIAFRGSLQLQSSGVAAYTDILGRFQDHTSPCPALAAAYSVA